jgi:hypothetical protein
LLFLLPRYSCLNFFLHRLVKWRTFVDKDVKSWDGELATKTKTVPASIKVERRVRIVLDYLDDLAENWQLLDR